MPPSQTQSCEWHDNRKTHAMLQQISHNMTGGAEIKPDRQVCQVTYEYEWNEAESPTPIRARFHLKVAGFSHFLDFSFNFSGVSLVQPQ